jgi:hypothetical protein
VGTYYNVDLNFNKNHTVVVKSKKFGSWPGGRHYTDENNIIYGSFKSNKIDGLAYILSSHCFYATTFKDGYLHGNSITISPLSTLGPAIGINCYNKAIEYNEISLEKSEDLNLNLKNKKLLLKTKKYYEEIITSLVNEYNWFPSAFCKNKKEYLEILKKWSLISAIQHRGVDWSEKS